MVERKIQHILDDYGLGRLCKPEIQRGYVWDRTAVAKLFDSLYNEYPIGAFLFWKPQNVTYFKGLADQKKPKNPIGYVTNNVTYSIGLKKKML